MKNMINDIHVHKFSGRTSIHEEHDHGYNLTSGTTVYIGASHVHFYGGFTSTNHGHKHYLWGWSGPAIPFADGSHNHFYSGITSRDFEHRHSYRGFFEKNK